jgi:hypothetical protein
MNLCASTSFQLTLHFPLMQQVPVHPPPVLPLAPGTYSQPTSIQFESLVIFEG